MEKLGVGTKYKSEKDSIFAMQDSKTELSQTVDLEGTEKVHSNGITLKLSISVPCGR